MTTPEDPAREHIDQVLEKSSWKVQNTESTNLNVRCGIAPRNSSPIRGHTFVDLLSIEWKTARVIGAKEEVVIIEGIEAAAAIKGQHQIVVEVERRLSLIDGLEAAAETNLTRADRLRQSVLARVLLED